MRTSVVLAALFAVACGAATPRAETGGDNATPDGPVLLRVRASLGARYGMTSHAIVRSAGSIVVADGAGTMEVTAVDAGMGRTSFACRFDAMRMTDANGVPMPGFDGLDLVGVVYAFDLDDRGDGIGEVRMAGTTAANRAFAESVRATVSSSFAHLPEAPVSIGDAWPDANDVPIPLGPQVLLLHCESTNRLVSFDRTTGETLAIVATEGTCSLPPTAVAGGMAEVRSTATSESRIAVSDGMTRSAESRASTAMRMVDAAGTVVLDLVMEQEQVSTMRPL